MNFQGTAKINTGSTSGTSISLDPKLNPTLVKWAGGITLALIVIIVILVVVSYVTRKVFFTPYKAKPAPADKTNVYYPNGEPDPTTGKPKDVVPLSGTKQGVSSTLTSNLNNYFQYIGDSTNGWAAVPNTNN
jgi:hypothetical protein